MKKIFFSFALCCATRLVFSQVMFNEFHYDNFSADVDERIEIAGFSGTNMSGWEIYMYEGSSGTSYSNFALSGVLGTDCTINGQNIGLQVYKVFDITGFSFQNGSPDGIALVHNGAVVELLAYEGSFTGTAGPANGMLFPDCGAMEPATAAVGSSIQRTGAAAWVFADGVNTFGTCNSGQIPVVTAVTTPESDNEAALLFPNPTSGAVHLRYSSERAGELYLSVHSTNGNTAFQTVKTLRQGDNLFEFDWSAFPRGLYVIQLKSEQGLELKKIRIQ